MVGHIIADFFTDCSSSPTTEWRRSDIARELSWLGILDSSCSLEQQSEKCFQRTGKEQAKEPLRLCLSNRVVLE